MNTKWVIARSALMAVMLFGGVLTVGTAQATTQDFSFTGTFHQDDDVQLFYFTVNDPSTVVLRTWSYAGGTNANGDTIARGGFDPILALFDSSGNYIDSNDDGGCGNVAADAVTQQCWDTYFSDSLAAGDYTVSVMEYDNFAIGPNLSNGFSRDGLGNFTATPVCDVFCDVSGDTRDDHWAFDILGADQATTPSPPPPVMSVPEPGSLGMLVFGLLMTGWLIRRRRLA